MKNVCFFALLVLLLNAFLSQSCYGIKYKTKQRLLAIFKRDHGRADIENDPSIRIITCVNRPTQRQNQIFHMLIETSDKNHNFYAIINYQDKRILCTKKVEKYYNTIEFLDNGNVTLVKYRIIRPRYIF